ncbi:YtxH domain-containing protein [Myxococcus sp. RHSTA-1-4]|uniref:YtxH domain-containing protein n=1 Tax=Myxococcus sp. RHSTA-1-4 TaxID=2874601 RepID=UPI001CBCFC7D|nr:YtxH domain-containing protein [Myxococcus sp. RHSTA-1-4]MBZ4422048.1 YtxH domain-containing protein [Myxococcus sp. RHSTA-1-4]
MFAAKKTTWMAKGLAKSDLARKLVARKLISDLPRAAKERWEDMDADDVLRLVGLTTYKPARVGLGGIGVFLIGVAAGGVAALLLAPKTGTELRTTVKDKAMGYMSKQNIGIGGEKTANA